MIQLIGPVFLTDGYGQMMRELCLGLLDIGQDITIYSITFGKEPDLKNLRPEYERLKHYVNRAGDVKTAVQCLTADNFPRFRVPGSTNIGYCMWETTKLPQHWPKLCNAMDKIFVPSTFCKKVFTDSGVKKVEILPLGTDTAKFDDVKPNEHLREVIGDRLAFYSIFEWSERKNPSALLNSYYSSFGADDYVALVIKSYGTNINQKALEHRLNITRHDVDYPKVIVIDEFLTTNQIMELHRSCDVYLGPVRGEGWSIPMFDAALAGNHVIATNFSSHTDFLDTYHSHKFQVYDLCRYQLEPVHSMHSLYSPDQEWASVNMAHFIHCMQQAYVNRRHGSEHHLSYVEELKKRYHRKAIAEQFLRMI